MVYSLEKRDRMTRDEVKIVRTHFAACQKTLAILQKAANLGSKTGKGADSIRAKAATLTKAYVPVETSLRQLLATPITKSGLAAMPGTKVRKAVGTRKTPVKAAAALKPRKAAGVARGLKANAKIGRPAKAVAAARKKRAAKAEAAAAETSAS